MKEREWKGGNVQKEERERKEHASAGKVKNRGKAGREGRGRKVR